VALGQGNGDRDQFGAVDVVGFGGPSRPSWRWLSRLALACVVVGAVVLVVARSGGHHRSSPPAPAPQPPVTVTDVGHSILGIRAGWELFALRQRALVSVQFASGRITRTALPPPEGDGIVSVIPDPAAVLIRPLDNVPGYLVPDGQPARQLTGLLARGALLLPGPGPAEVWDIGATGPIALVGASGRQQVAHLTAEPAQFPPQSAMADGRGNVLILDDSGQLYDAGPGLLRPVGALVVAVGPRNWLGLNCGQGAGCHDVVINAATGATRVLPGSPLAVINLPWPEQAGAVSPDGATAAVIAQGRDGAAVLDLVDLGSGAVTPVAVPVAALASSQTIAWSPDSRWLFVVTVHGTLAAVNARSGQVHDLGLGLSGLSQVVIRPASG
jgi:DNA-binding beta-propeller fold protein YncE